MNNKPRSKVNFVVFEHEDDPKFVDFTLELTNFPREKLFDFLTAVSAPFEKHHFASPPDQDNA